MGSSGPVKLKGEERVGSTSQTLPFWARTVETICG